MTTPIENLPDPIVGYKIIEVIYPSENTIVCRGLAPTDGREVALKLFREDPLKDPALSRRFQRGAEITQSLRHLNILTIYAWGAAEGYQYIAMEYLPKTLLEWRDERGDELTLS